MLLATLVGVLGFTTPWTAPTARPGRYGGDLVSSATEDSAAGLLPQRHPEANGASPGKPSPQNSTSFEFAECDSEESDEDEDPPPLVVPFGELFWLLGSDSPWCLVKLRSVPVRLAPVPLFLICQHLVC